MSINSEMSAAGSSRILQLILVTMCVLLLDQVSKWVILAYLRDTSQVVEVTSFFNLRLGFNTGVSFGLFRDIFENASWIPVIISLMIVVGLLIWALRTNRCVERISLAVIVGGALGNIVDRWRQGAVTDFLDFHWSSWYWPAFNGADTFIIFGAICLLLSGISDTQQINQGPSSPNLIEKE